MAIGVAVLLFSLVSTLSRFGLEKAEMSGAESLRTISQCACGELQIVVPLSELEKPGELWDCHCPQCRTFHVSAFASFVSSAQVSIQGDTKKFYLDACETLGRVDRILCRQCHTKLATRDLKSDSLYVNMGSLEESSIPKTILDSWRMSGRHQSKRDQRALWATALPEYNPKEPVSDGWTMNKLRGRCGCGQCSYMIESDDDSTELQHCYCGVCRYLSGSAFMSWLPVEREQLKWTSSTVPPLVRTTPHGQRHVCPTCQGVLTIVYDSQPDLIWPAAGALENWPENTSQHLYRVVHICCDYHPSWYPLPNDGLDRIAEAS